MKHRSLPTLVLWLVLSPLIIPLVALAMVAVAALAVYSWVALRWISWSNQCWHYLVYSPRSGWNEFVANNLIPALPSGVEPISFEGRRIVTLSLPLSAMVRRGMGVPKPYLASVTALGVRTYSLNRELWKLKTHAARDQILQATLRDFIIRSIAGE
jgi:hypothetical protein